MLWQVYFKRLMFLFMHAINNNNYDSQSWVCNFYTFLLEVLTFNNELNPFVTFSHSCNGVKHILQKIIIGYIFFYLTGSVWVYPNYGKRFADDFTPCTGNVTTSCSKDCNETLMKFSFAMVTIDWVFLAAGLVFILFMVCKACSSR